MKKLFFTFAFFCFMTSFLFAFKPIDFKIYNPIVEVESGEHIVMDFIGFKTAHELSDGQKENWETLYRGSGMFYHFGETLQSQNLANAREYAYFGQFSLQELAAYKSLARYVTFVEVFYQEWNVFSQLGTKTEITFAGVYNIFVYDTKEKMICLKKTVFVPDPEILDIMEDVYKGFFYDPRTDKRKIYDYYASFVCNALLEEYSELSKKFNTNN